MFISTSISKSILLVVGILLVVSLLLIFVLLLVKEKLAPSGPVKIKINGEKEYNGKDDFKKLLKAMNYKIFEKNNEVFFKYYPRKKTKKVFNIKNAKESPFGILKNLDFN